MNGYWKIIKYISRYLRLPHHGLLVSANGDFLALIGTKNNSPKNKRQGINSDQNIHRQLSFKSGLTQRNPVKTVNHCF